MGKKVWIVLAAVAAVVVVSIGAFGVRNKPGKEQETVSSGSLVSAASADSNVVSSAVSSISAEPIGDVSEGENVYQVALINKTQKIITEVTVKDLDSEEYPANMLKDGEVFRPDEKRKLYFDASESMQKTEALNSDSSYSDAERVEPDYTLKVTVDAGNTYELHSFPFGDIDEGQICYDESSDLCYLVYTSKQNGEEVNTLEQEKQRKTLAAMQESTTVDNGTATQGTNTEEEFSYDSYDNEASYEEPTGDYQQEEDPSFSLEEPSTSAENNDTY